MAVYAQESRSQPPDKENKLIFGEYAASKLRAERIVLDANGTRLKNGNFYSSLFLFNGLINFLIYCIYIYQIKGGPYFSDIRI